MIIIIANGRHQTVSLETSDNDSDAGQNDSSADSSEEMYAGQNDEDAP